MIEGKGSFAQIQSKDAGCSSKCDSDIPGIGKVYSAGIIRENPDLLNGSASADMRFNFENCYNQ